MQKKWKKIADRISELQDILTEGVEHLSKFYNNRGIKPEMHVGKESTWKTIHSLRETEEKIHHAQQSMKKVIILTKYSIALNRDKF